MAVNLPTAAREWKPKGKALAIEKKRVVLARKEDSMVKRNVCPPDTKKRMYRRYQEGKCQSEGNDRKVLSKKERDIWSHC